MFDRDNHTMWWPYIAILALTAILGVILVDLDTFESMYDYTRAHEDWELDEYISIALASVFGLIAALVVRSVQLREQISRRKTLEAEAYAMARHDALTGLPNRRFFGERADAMLKEAAAAKHCVAVLALDLDRFKPVNDIYGHAIGDRVLQIVSDRMQAELPEGAIASRMGGDEFTVLIPVSDTSVVTDTPPMLERVARRICLRIAEPIQAGAHELNVTTSIGIALFPTDGENFHTLHSNADMAMYAAKAAGRNTFTYFEPRLGEEHRKRHELETELGDAIAEGQIVPYLQPVFDLASGELTGFEILARWHHPKRGVLLPDEFIAMAEDSGRISALSDSVLRQACKAVAGWRPPMRFSFNLSPVQFREPRLVERIVAALEETGMPRGSLEIEITEAVFIDDDVRAREVIEALRAHDIAVVLDDFGKGYSSLSYLSRFEIDKLKIDHAFIAGRHADARNEKIVNSIIQLGRSLGIQTTAEGVEQPDDASWLAERGCLFGQGYYYSGPMPLLSAMQFFEGHKQGASEGGGPKGPTAVVRNG
ncbi:EAL domain-containing protein [Oricola sp.]|uniref:putative bifunctional diguanylate cyclase/phosphodiesterase n=1 Tax=Oricola sp. TaxID=1979950 RepID=UPI0025E92200|nr:EAL domain-containing protein [Oricola sp.]MCI5075825.1 EAL domain-containing protein [Oricola sp.]